MNDIILLPPNTETDREQSFSEQNHNASVIPILKKTNQKRRSKAKNNQLHVLPQRSFGVSKLPNNKKPNFRVLLVENNAADRLAYQNALNESPDSTFDSMEAGNGKEALSLIGLENFDCILLGHPITDTCGTSFFEELKKLGSSSESEPAILKVFSTLKTCKPVEGIEDYRHDFLIMDHAGHYLELLPMVIQRLVRRNEHALEKQLMETPYLSLLEQNSLITYIAAPDNGNPFIYVSPQIQRLSHFNASWLKNPEMRFHEILHEDRPAVEKAFAKSYRDGEMFRCEYRMLSKTGKIHWFLDEAKQFRSHNKGARFLQGMILDITDKKKMESELSLHRYLFEQSLQERTKYLEKRIKILECCNAELSEQLENERRKCNELRKIEVHENIARTGEG